MRYPTSASSASAQNDSGGEEGAAMTTTSIQQRVDHQNRRIEEEGFESPGRGGSTQRRVEQGRGGANLSPRGVASPDKAMRQRQQPRHQQQQYHRQDLAGSDVGLGLVAPEPSGADIAGGSGVGAPTSPVCSPAVDLVLERGGGVPKIRFAAAVEGRTAPTNASGRTGRDAAAAGEGVGEETGGGMESDEMRSLRLSLLTDQDDEKNSHAVPVSRLKRAMGELIVQDDVIDSLQVELEQLRNEHDELGKELGMCKEAMAVQRSRDGRDEEVQMLRDECERERTERIRLDRALVEEETAKAEGVKEGREMAKELERVRAELAERIEEEERQAKQKRQQEQLRERAERRRAEDMAVLNAELEELRRLKFAPPSASAATARGVSVGDDGDETKDAAAPGRGDGSAMTHLPPAKTAKAFSANDDRHRPPSPSRSAAEELSYRTELVDLKLRLSDAEAKAKDEIHQLAADRAAALGDVERLESELKSERKALEEVEEGRKKVEEELRQSREAEVGFRKANDILRARLEKGLAKEDEEADEEFDPYGDPYGASAAATSRAIIAVSSDGTTPQEDDELRRSRETQSDLLAELQKKDEEISRLHNEAERLTKVLPDLNNQVVVAKKKANEELSRSREVETDLKGQVGKLKKEIVELESDAVKSKSNLLAELQKKDEEIATLKSAMEQLTSVLPDLQQQILDAKEESDGKLSRSMEVKTSLKDHVSKLQKEIVELDSDLVKSMSKADDEMKEAEDRMSVLQTKLSEAEEARNRAEEVLVVSTEEQKAMQAELDELKTLVDDAEVALNETREEIQDIRHENEDLQLMLDEAEHSAELIEREIKAGVEADRSLRVEIGSLRELLNATETEAKTTKADLEEEIEKVKKDSAEQLTKAALEQAKPRDSAEAALSAELSSLKEQMASAEAMFGRAKEQHDVEWEKQKNLEGLLHTKIRVLTKKLSTKEELLSKAHEHLKAEADVNVANASLRSENAELRNRLVDGEKQRTSAENEVKKQSAVNNSLRSKIADLDDRLADTLTQLTTVEDDLRQHLEVEAELRDAVENLEKALRKHKGNFPIM